MVRTRPLSCERFSVQLQLLLHQQSIHSGHPCLSDTHTVLYLSHACRIFLSPWKWILSFYWYPLHTIHYDISEWSKIIVLPEAVYILVDCNQADILLSQQFHILSDFQIISSHSAHIFNQNRSDFPRLYFFHHGKKAWAIKSCTGDTIISKMNKIGKSMFFCILFQQFLLIWNTVGFPV